MSEVLSQGEVDALLRGVGDGEIKTETDKAVSYTHLPLPTKRIV